VGKSRITAQLNVDNLLDKSYFTNASPFGTNSANVNFSTPRTLWGRSIFSIESDETSSKLHVFYRRASQRTSALFHCNSGWSAVRRTAPFIWAVAAM